MGGRPSPNNLRIQFDDRLLHDLYVTRCLPFSEVARRLGVGTTTISRRCRELGIRARQRGPVARSRIAEDGSSGFAWTPELAWVVGLIATDGNLSSNGRAISVTSKDVDLLESIRRCMHLTARITPNSGGYGLAYRLQWTSRRFHTWLMSLGLTPAKSLTIGALQIPDDLFADFLRGCIDGDGSIVTYVDRFNVPKNSKYVYDRLFVSIVSASPAFLEWIRRTLLRLQNVCGHLTVTKNATRRVMWRLRYAKRDSVNLLHWMYYSPDVPALRRKRERAERALMNVTWYRHPLSNRLGGKKPV